MLIGPKDSISMGVLETGTNTFYRSLLQKGDGGQALRDMNEATNNAFCPFSGWGWWPRFSLGGIH
jgi:hypothetical protein